MVQKIRIRLAHEEIGAIHTFLVQVAYLIQFERDCLGNEAICSKDVQELSQQIGDQIARKSSSRPFTLSPHRAMKIRQCIKELRGMIQQEKLRSLERSVHFLDALQEKSKIVDNILGKD